MLNKVSTVSIMLIIAIGLIIFFGVKNGKCGQSTTKPTTTPPATGTDTGATASAFRGRR